MYRYMKILLVLALFTLPALTTGEVLIFAGIDFLDEEEIEKLKQATDDNGVIKVFLHLAKYREYSDAVLYNNAEAIEQFKLRVSDNRAAIHHMFVGRSDVTIWDPNPEAPNMSITLPLQDLLKLVKTRHVYAVSTIEYVVPHLLTLGPNIPLEDDSKAAPQLGR